MSADPAPARENTPLYLPGVESNVKPGLYKDLIDSALADATPNTRKSGICSRSSLRLPTACRASAREFCGRRPRSVRRCGN